MPKNFINIGLIIISWISLIFLPKKSFYKYLPVSIFTSLLVICTCILSIRYRWWGTKGGMAQLVFMDLSFISGPFFAGTLWIFHFTFGKFKRFFLLNAIMDIALAYPLTYLFQKLKVYQLINLRPLYLSFMHMSFATIIYGYQLLIERSRKSLYFWN